MRMFRELRLVLNSILGSMKSMFWAGVLITTVSFIFGLCFLQATTEHLREKGVDWSNPSTVQLTTYWGSVAISMYSLYKAALGGVDWETMAKSLQDVGGTFFFLFLVYIGFFFCVITNTLTSLFVEATMINAEKDQQQIIQAELDQKGVYIGKLRKVFMKMSSKDGESVSLDAFLSHMEEPDMVYFAATIGIEVVDLKQFFTVLSSGGRRLVDLETFVVGCIKLKGWAKSMDLMDMSLGLKQETADLSRSIRRVDRKIDKVAAALGVFESVQTGRVGSKPAPPDRDDRAFTEHTTDSWVANSPSKASRVSLDPSLL